jgi:excisionase family DNA binding protein
LLDVSGKSNQQIPFEPLAVSVDQAAKLLGVGKTSIYSLISENQISTIHCGRRRLVVFQSLKSYVARSAQPTLAEGQSDA